MMKIKNNKIIVSTIVGIVVVALIGGYFLFMQPKSAEAEWFNDQWFYRKKVEITNAGTAQTDFQVMITLDTATLITANKIQSDCDDISRYKWGQLYFLFLTKHGDSYF